MRQDETIPSLRVCVPEEGKVRGRAQEVPYMTALFRKDTCMREVLDFTLGRIAGRSNLAAAVIGCSIGAELDSLLALCNREGGEVSATITGIDASRTAVEAASRGLYKLYHARAFGEEDELPTAKALRESGFTTAYERLPEPFSNSARVIVDAAGVRQGHSVRIAEHDAEVPLPVEGELDLTVASNLLYHLDTDKAVRIARNMADVLADRGVLSLGSADSHYFRSYTRAPMETMLSEDFGLEPAPIAAEGLMMYARV